LEVGNGGGGGVDSAMLRSFGYGVEGIALAHCQISTLDHIR
jgi:hypothetical protein